MKYTILILSLAIGFASCKGTNKVTTAKDGIAQTDRKKAACGDLHIDMNQPHIDWYEESNSILSKSEEILVLPKDYKVYAVDTAQLAAFFNAVQNKKTVSTVVPLPKPAGCQLFTVKYGEDMHVTAGTIAGLGECKGQQLKLTYYMGKMGGYVNWFELEYEMITKYIQGKPYVLVYSKMPPPKTENLPSDPATPVLQEIKYDK